MRRIHNKLAPAAACFLALAIAYVLSTTESDCEHCIRLQATHHWQAATGTVQIGTDRLHWYSDWQGLGLEVEVKLHQRIARVAKLRTCSVVYLDRRSSKGHYLAARSYVLNSGQCILLILRNENDNIMLTGHLSSADQEELKHLIKAGKIERASLLIAPAEAPHSYALLSVLRPEQVVLIGTVSSVARARYGWFGIDLTETQGLGAFCAQLPDAQWQCRSSYKPWWYHQDTEP